MSRRSLRSRSNEYKKRRQETFDHFQTLLRRQEIRLTRGDYRETLTREESIKVRKLIQSALVVILTGYRVTVTKASALDKPRRTYYKICKILRQAGSRARPIKTQQKVILRKDESPNR